MFLETAGQIRVSDGMPMVMKNAFVESFTVHARVLLNVFYPKNPRSDDVLAGDFLDDPAMWERKRPALSSSLQALEGRVGKEVAHLTYARLAVTPEQKPWMYVDITRDFLAVIAAFINLVPPTRLDPEWHKLPKEA